MAKRALASSSSGQPSQPKRPFLRSTDQVWQQSERNVVPRSWLPEDDARRVRREEAERTAESFQSYMGNAFEEMMQQIMKNVVQQLFREELERAKSDWTEYFQSCFRNALKDIVQQMPSENVSQRPMETVELANIHSPHLGRANAESAEKNDVRNLRLQLQTKLPDHLYTGKKLEGEGGAPISVALKNANTGDFVTSGPESSIKLEVVVLEGDFDKDDEDDWAQEEFENCVVKERKGRGPLLTGDLLVKLRGGVGELGKLIFTDNSSWNRSKRFRIGLKVALGYCGNTRIREAKTDAFRVMEHRGESSRKHNSPAFDDEVWRLKKIARGGIYYRNLNSAGIHKVGDFLLQLFTDPMKLKKILGDSMIPKNWDILVDHAKTCKIDQKLYLYYSDGMRNHGAVFNTDGQLIGLIKDRVSFATHRLSAQEKECGFTIVKEAQSNWKDVREFNGETFSGSMEKKSSSSFPSQVFEGQIENSTPVQRYLAPPILPPPVGPEAPPTNAGFTAEGRLNVQISAGDNNITAVGLPIPSRGINSQCAMRSQMINFSAQMDHAENGNFLPSEPPYASTPSFPSSSTLPLSEGNNVADDWVSAPFDIDWDSILADPIIQNSPDAERYFQNPACYDASVRGTSKGVIGWLKIKAVLQWGFFKRGVRIVQLDEPLIEVQA